jgi:hypothetical protein
MWNIGGWDYVDKVHQLCYVLQKLCGPCRCVMIWASDCLYGMCTRFWLADEDVSLMR